MDAPDEVRRHNLDSFGNYHRRRRDQPVRSDSGIQAAAAPPGAETASRSVTYVPAADNRLNAPPVGITARPFSNSQVTAEHTCHGVTVRGKVESWVN